MPLSKSTTFLTRLKNLTTIERRRRRIEPPLSSFHHRSQQQSSPSPPYLPEFVGALPGKHLNLHNHILTLIRHNNGTVDSFFIQTRTVAFQASTKGSLEDHCAELVEQLDPARLNEESKAGLIPVDPLDLAVEKENDKSASEELIKGLKAQMKEAGYVPDLGIDQELNIDRESMEGALLAHSEGLALSHGLLSSPPRTQIRIIKNLLVCKDCHNALKIIAKIVGREISIQEKRKHHLFKDGKCSCNK